jgi:sodium transport system permease protein
MPLHSIGVVYRKELTEALRDRRTLISSVLVPLLIFPLMSVGFIGVAIELLGKADKETTTVMVLGGENSPGLLADLAKSPQFKIVDPATNWKDQIVSKEVRAAVEIPVGFDANLAEQKLDTIKIYDYKNELKSELTAGHLEKEMENYRDGIVKERLAAKNLPAAIIKPFDITKNNVAPVEKASGASIGGLIGYMVILLCMTGAMYPAMDLTAGEKERGTIETILSSPISRMNLVLGKFLLVLTASLVTAALSVFSMGVSFWASSHFDLFHAATNPDAAALQLHLSPVAIASVFLMAVPIAVLFSAALITISLFAKTYKEAQSYITPLMFLVIIPAVAAMLPGVELDAKLSLIPILNVSLLCKELIAATYHWNFIAVIFLSTCVYAAAALFIAIKMFQRESVLFRS